MAQPPSPVKDLWPNPCFSALFAPEAGLVRALSGPAGRRSPAGMRRPGRAVRQFESQAPGERRGFHQLDAQRVAHLIGQLAALADQRLALFVMMEIVAAQ